MTPLDLIRPSWAIKLWHRIFVRRSWRVYIVKDMPIRNKMPLWIDRERNMVSIVKPIIPEENMEIVVCA